MCRHRLWKTLGLRKSFICLAEEMGHWSWSIFECMLTKTKINLKTFELTCNHFLWDVNLDVNLENLSAEVFELFSCLDHTYM